MWSTRMIAMWIWHVLSFSSLTLWANSLCDHENRSLSVKYPSLLAALSGVYEGWHDVLLGRDGRASHDIIIAAWNRYRLSLPCHELLQSTLAILRLLNALLLRVGRGGRRERSIHGMWVARRLMEWCKCIRRCSTSGEKAIGGRGRDVIWVGRHRNVFIFIWWSELVVVGYVEFQLEKERENVGNRNY